MLVITKHLDIGGTEKMLLRILPSWISMGFKIDILLLYNYTFSVPKEWNKCNISYIYPQKTRIAKQDLKTHPDLIYKKYVKKNYDVEIAFQEGFPTKIISKSTNKKSIKIAWVHSNFEQYHFSSTAYWNDADESQAYNAFDKIVFCSYSACNAFNKVFVNNVKYKEIIYSPINIRLIQQMSNEYNIQIPRPYFLTISRFSPQKGLDRLVNACQLLSKKYSDLLVVIVGGGEQEVQIKDYIEAESMKNNIMLIPPVRNPFPYIKSCMAYISPSYTESFGIAVQEALTMGKPVIACKTPGTCEVLGDGKYGYIVELSNESLADTIESFLIDNAFRKNLEKKSKNGQAYWKEQSHVSQHALRTLFLPNSDIN